MSYSKFLCLILLSAFSLQLHARLFIDVSITNKKGIDKGLTLGSELHSIEEVNYRKSTVLRMRSGIQVILDARFANPEEVIKDEKTFGPISQVKVTGKILNSAGEVLKNFTENPVFIALGESTVVTHSKDSQLVEVKLRPHLK